MSASFYDLLKFAKTGIASPSMTYYDKQKALAMCKAGFPVKTLTGVPPLTFQSDGTPLTAWSISGNMTQTGKPTPSAPIQPEETGDRTANLWDEDYTGISTTIKYVPIYVGSGTFTLSSETPYDLSVANLFLLSGNVSSGASTNTNGVWYMQNRTVNSESGYVTIAFRQYQGTRSPADFQTMLNTGSTALPYEPYGYKIPLTCAGQTQTVYLDEPLRKIGDYADVLGANGVVTRTIKPVVLTGSETWILWSNNYYSNVIDKKGVMNAIFCSHFVNGSGGMTYDNGSLSGLKIFASAVPFVSSVQDLTQWLADEYAAGHPVTVWYAQKTPTTETVTVPTLTPQKGSNTLTVGTTLQPSEVSITGGIK